MGHPHELRTKRLLLRAFRESDVGDMVRLAGAREVAATTARIPHPYREEHALQFLHMQETDKNFGYVFAVTLLASGELIGAVGLHPDPLHPRAELGYWIGVPYWGNGYATEAAAAVVDFGFKTLQLHRIFAGYFKGNDASRRILEKLGMKHEGCAREHVEKWGKFVDEYKYGLLAQEWRQSKK
jgi:RimJ/RimL family protein N-acetyltransferase